MRSTPPLLLGVLVCLPLGSCVLSGSPPEHGPWCFDASVYPQARREELVEDHFGTAVADPYRWLEDSDAPETKAWIADQMRLTQAVLERLPQRASLRARLTQLWGFERWGLPISAGGRLFYTHNPGLAHQPVLMVRDDPHGLARVLFDPNALSTDGTRALAGASVSRDGRWLAYGVADGGSDWSVWRVRDVRSGQDQPDELRWCKFTRPAWTAGGEGFFYTRYAEPAPGTELSAMTKGQKLCFHRLGTPQADDLLILERPDQPEWNFGADVSDDGDYLVVSARRGTDPQSRLWFAELGGGVPAAGRPVILRELSVEGDASFDFVGNRGATFFLLTDLEAPRRRLVALDLAQPQRNAWRTLIPQGEDTLESVSWVQEQFWVRRLRHARSVLEIHDASGAPRAAIALPGLGSVRGLAGREGDAHLYFSFAGFATPPEIWRVDTRTRASELVFRAQLPFDPERFETRQLSCISKDGTRIPLFLCWSKRVGARVGRERLRTLLYGYGGFNLPVTPRFDPAWLAWMEGGGLLAVAVLRGGGEYGEEWHRAGTRASKQNVFDDFIAAAEHLCREGYTRPERLAIRGSSNGGLLVGACLVQRPDLFGCALPDVGVLDMLRFHKFTVGWGWTGDYGSPDDARDFAALLAYSPYHNVEPGVRYPPTLITTAERDDRVVPAHSFKFAAALQHAQPDGGVILIRIEPRAGHGAGKSTEKQIDQAADELAFASYVTSGARPPIELGRAPGPLGN